MEIDITPQASAQAAGLRYASDDDPGLRRRRWGQGFRYWDERTKAFVEDGAEVERCKALVIPPAWEDVWISPHPNAHLLATGRDERGRKQYRYHPQWVETRNALKFERIAFFGQALPTVRGAAASALRKRTLSRGKVLGAVVTLLDRTLIRIGNREYAAGNDSYGLTTFRDKHARFDGDGVTFRFNGKSGVAHEIDLKDRTLARVVKACRDVPGYDLFQYYDEDEQRQTISSSDVNAYLQEITGQPFTAKDFRTWGGTVLAARALRTIGPAASNTDCKKHVVACVKDVAEQLGNTPAVCRSYYIHPALIEAYENEELIDALVLPDDPPEEWARLDEDEQRVLAFLLRREG